MGRKARVIGAGAVLAALAIIVASVVLLQTHRTLRAFAVTDGHPPHVIHIESPCSRWQDLFGDCEIPAGTW